MNQHSTSTWRLLRNRFTGWMGILLMLWSQLSAAPINIANTPLFLTSNVDPNIMFIIDDSGSMRFELMPDDIIYSTARFIFPRADNVYGTGAYNNRVPTVDANDPYNAFSRSSQTNTVYYDPSITYTPWVKHDGSLYPNAAASCALHNPKNTTADFNRDLCINLTVENENHNEVRWISCASQGRDCSATTANKKFWPATYFVLNDTDNVWDWNSYTKVEIKEGNTYSGDGRENRTDCVAGVCTYAQEIQNFANWYTYYRSRTLAARAGIGRAFAEQSEGMRVGYGAINKGSENIDQLGNTQTIVRGVRPFSGEDRKKFFELLYESDVPAMGTPLRRALDDAGKYFSSTSNRGPWGAVPGSNVSTDHLQCRQSFTILMTDGYWSGTVPTGIGDQDNKDGSLIEGPGGQSYQYIATADENRPFFADRGDTLADVAMKYWKNDLRPLLPNRVPTTDRNPAFWQHMVTYGVGLGVTGSITPDEAWKAFWAEEKIEWPEVNTNAGKIDDLLHAAINSRGGFFSAAEPDVFADELGAVLRDIVAQVEGSATAAATSSSVLRTDTVAYSAGFRSTDWSGLLQAHEILPGGVRGPLVWDAEQTLRNRAAPRKLYTYNSDTDRGVDLDLNQLAATQRASIDIDGRGSDRLNWLAGTEFGDLRSRSGTGAQRLLGDIIYSNPQFVGRQSFGYGTLNDYHVFRGTIANRADVIYVGANSGFLHAFDAQSGEELFAYMPSTLLGTDPAQQAPIASLMEEDYQHRYFMDGTPVIADAYVDNQWRTLLIGTQGLGGRTVFALDITDPENFDPEDHILWEFTHDELGYNVGQPTIVQTRDGKWRAVFGNGYNSANNKAQLFVVNLDDPDDFRIIDTGEGSAAQPNGLAAPLLLNYPNSDRRASRSYAGDLLGNLWRFNLADADPENWTAVKTFTATDPDNGLPQPITTRPVAALDQRANGLIVSFGTGSYFRNQDSAENSTQIQSLYGVFDGFTGGPWTRANLLEQEIIFEDSVTVEDAEGNEIEYESLRVVSDNDPETSAPSEHRGWVLDLIHDNKFTGERVISRPTRPSGDGRGSVRFTTLVPNEDPCSTGRAGFLMDLDIFTGGRHAFPVFDLDGDGSITSGGGDTITITITDSDGSTTEVEVPVSGVGNITQGEELRVVTDEDGIDNIVPDINNPGTNNPGLLGGERTTGRQAWEQIR
ncbi:PilC/PilY family type IV pilus protein [Salinispirillum sp. LH 10-3-1]|uniref:PilC/PilY family type IV pilus protein n=1 Tax=Salinispirillum sp. LH 10-3-1 TaxID=2952525 RepID=A0AB38YJ42_9GAMM